MLPYISPNRCLKNLWMYPTTFESQSVTDAHYISRFPIQCLLSLFKTLGARRAKHILYF